MHAHRDGQWSRVSHRMALFGERNTFEGLVERHTGSGGKEKREFAVWVHPRVRAEFWAALILSQLLSACDCVEVKVIISESHQGGKGQQRRNYRARGWIKGFVYCFSYCVLFIFVYLPLTH